MTKLVKLLKLNGLEYNANRDPQVYRRVPGKPFRIEAELAGKGIARVQFAVDGETAHESTVALPGRLEFTVGFESPGIRVGELIIENEGVQFQRRMRLDVDEQAWVG